MSHDVPRMGLFLILGLSMCVNTIRVSLNYINPYTDKEGDET